MTRPTTGPTLLECFEGMPDPRIERCRRHQLIDIVVMSICAVIGGAEGFTDMEEFGKRTGWSRGSSLPKPIAWQSARRERSRL